MILGSRILAAAGLLSLAAAALVPAPVPAAAPAIVANPAKAPTERQVTLTQHWRVGGEDDAEVLLGQIGSAAVDRSGHMYVLDTQLSHVLVFGPDGKLARTLGREGEGPGEMRRPLGIDVRPDGTVGVVQPFPGKVIYLAPDGKPAGEFTLGGDDPAKGGLAIISGARERGGHLVIAAARNNLDMATGSIREVRYLASADRAKGETHRHAEVAIDRNVEKMVFDEVAEWFPGERGRWDVGPDGKLYFASRFDAYEIAVHGPDGALERTITRPHEPRKRTDEERQEMRGGRRMNINGREPQIEERFSPVEPAIGYLTVLDDGTLWVVNSHGRDDWAKKGIMRYDVFEPDGRLREEVAVTVPEGGEGNRLLLLSDGRFLLVRGQERISVSIAVGPGGGGQGQSASEADDKGVPIELVCFGAAR